MKAAKDREEKNFMAQLVKKTFMKRTQTRLGMWEELFKKVQWLPWLLVLECLFAANQEVWVHRSFLSELLSSLMAVSAACAKTLQKVWEGPCWEGMWYFLDLWGCCGIAHDSQHLECAEEVWAA